MFTPLVSFVAVGRAGGRRGGGEKKLLCEETRDCQRNVVMHAILSEGSNGSPGLKHMKIFGSTREPLLHPLFTQEPAAAAPAPASRGASARIFLNTRCSMPAVYLNTL